MKYLLNNKLIKLGILFFIVLALGGGIFLYFTLNNNDKNDESNAEKTPQTVEKDKFFTIGDYSYSKEEIQKKVVSQFGLDYLLDTIDNHLLSNVTYSMEEKENILNRYIYGDDIESLTDDEILQHEQEFENELRYLGINSYEEREQYLDLICKREVYGKIFFKDWIYNNRNFFTEEQYQEVYKELYPDTSTIIILDFASFAQAYEAFDAWGLTINEQGKFYDISTGQYADQVKIATAFVGLYEFLSYNLSDEYTSLSLYYNITTEFIGGNYIDYLQFDIEELNSNQSGIMKFEFTYDELHDYYDSNIANLVFNKLKVADEENNYPLSFSCKKTHDGSYLFIYKIAETKKPTFQFLTEDEKNIQVPLEIFEEVIDYMYEEKYFGELQEFAMALYRSQNNFKISNEFLNTFYAGKVNYLGESCFKCLNFEDYIKIAKSNNKKNICSYTFENYNYELSNEEFYDGLIDKYGSIVYKDIVETYMILTSNKNNVYDPFNQQIYNQTAYSKLKDSLNQQDIKYGKLKSVADYKYAFENGMFNTYGFDKSYGWNNFLLDYLGCIDENELIGKILLSSIEERYLLNYYDYNMLLENFYEIDQNYYRMKLINIFVTTTISNYSYYDENFTSDQYYYAIDLLRKIESKFIEYSESDSFNKLKEIVDQYNNALMYDEEWGIYHIYGLRLNIESPQTYSSDSSLVEEFQYNATCAYSFLKDNFYYMLDNDTDFEEYYIYGTPFETMYGMHDIIVVNAYSNPYSYEQLGYYLEDFTLELYDKILSDKLVEDESSGNYDEELMNAINYYFTKSIDFIYSNEDKIKFINDAIKYKINEIALTFNDTTHYENLIDYIEQLA